MDGKSTHARLLWVHECTEFFAKKNPVAFWKTVQQYNEPWVFNDNTKKYELRVYA